MSSSIEIRQKTKLGTLLLLVSLLLLAGTSISGQRKKKVDPCANPPTQAEMTQCAGKEFQAADAVLNQLRVYIVLGILFGTLVGVLAGLALTRSVLSPLDRSCGLIKSP